MGYAASTFFVRQHACKSSFVSFVQFHQNPIDCSMPFGLLAVWMKLTTFAGATMNASFVSFSHEACPDVTVFQDKSIIV
jgi:hypothetical protein